MSAPEDLPNGWERWRGEVNADLKAIKDSIDKHIGTETKILIGILVSAITVAGAAAIAVLKYLLERT